MSIAIYYFSGTGNSLAVARDVAAAVDGTLRSIPSLMDARGRKQIPAGGDALGLVFPVYHKGLPLILKRFVETLEGLDRRYIFGIYTYGDSPGLAVRDLKRLIQSRGGQLAAGFGVQMPYNYLTPTFTLRDFLGSFALREVPLEKQQALIAQAEESVERIAAFVDARRSGVFDVTSDPLTRLADALKLPETLGKSVWLKVAGVDEPTALSFLESRQLMDRGFQVDERCNGCGVCEKICPIRNIRMIDRRPTWQQQCEQCFACLQWCPQEAIQFGEHTADQRRYRHPRVTLADMLRGSSQASEAV